MVQLTHPETPELLDIKNTGRDKSSPLPPVFVVVSGSTVPIFIVCGQMVKLKQISSLVT